MSLLCMESTGTARLRQEDLIPKWFSHTARKVVLVVGFSPYRLFCGQLGLPPQPVGLGNIKEFGGHILNPPHLLKQRAMFIGNSHGFLKKGRNQQKMQML